MTPCRIRTSELRTRFVRFQRLQARSRITVLDPQRRAERNCTMAWTHNLKPPGGIGFGPGWGGPAKGAGNGKPYNASDGRRTTAGPGRGNMSETTRAKRERNRKMREVYEQIADDPKAPPMARIAAATAWLDRKWASRRSPMRTKTT
jgi:hypothetical protein